MLGNLPIRKKGKDGETTTRLAGTWPADPFFVNTSGRITTNSPVNIADSRDLVPETAGDRRTDAVQLITSDNTRVGVGGRTSDEVGISHIGLKNWNDDWFRIIR